MKLHLCGTFLNSNNNINMGNGLCIFCMCMNQYFETFFGLFFDRNGKKEERNLLTALCIRASLSAQR